MKIYTLSTMMDWAHHCGSFGPLGITWVFDKLKVARIERVYWRCFEGGRASYPSEVAQVMVGAASPSLWQIGDGGGPKSLHYRREIDCTQFDPLAYAVQAAHDRGIELIAWWTISEEAHGLHLLSKMGQRTDLCLHDRKGNAYPGTIELGLKEVQDYKLTILDELRQRGVDGVMLDFVRHNATPSGDENGIHRFGYSPELCERFKQQDGRDPRDIPADDEKWLAFKNGYRADLIREVRKRLGPDKRLDVMTIPHVDNYRWLCLDLPALSRDRTIDMVMPHDMTHCNAPSTVAEGVRNLKNQLEGEHTKAAASAHAWWGNLSTEDYQAAIKAAEQAQAEALVLYEADQLVRWQLLTPTRAHHLGALAVDRAVQAGSLAARPTEQDWAQAQQHEGFFVTTGADRDKSKVPTRFAVLTSPEALHVRVVMDGPQAEVDPVLIREKRAFIDWIGARNYWLHKDAAHVLVDVGATRRGFLHFAGCRDGQKLQESRVQNPIDLPWELDVEQPSDDRWQATFTLPFTSLGHSPQPGERWGIQIVRMHATTGEASSWFVTSVYGVDAEEWGDVVFAAEQ